MTAHQCASHWLLSKLSGTLTLQLNHAAYNLDLAPSDYFLIRNQKYHLRETWFADDGSLSRHGVRVKTENSIFRA